MEKNFVEVLRSGTNSERNILNEDELENVLGGKVIYCEGGYVSEDGVQCPKKYIYDDEDKEAPEK